MRHVHAGVGEQFLFVCKHSFGHKSVQKANKQHAAVAYVNKIDAFVNYTAFQHRLLSWHFFLVHWAGKHQSPSISQHSRFSCLPPDLYQHIHVKAASGRQRRRGFHGRSLCSDAVEMQQRWTARHQARAQSNRSSCQSREKSPCEAAGEDQKTQKHFSLLSLPLHCKIAGSPAQAEPKQVFKPFPLSEFLSEILVILFSVGERKRGTLTHFVGRREVILQYRWQVYLGEQMAGLKRESTDVQALFRLSLREQSKDSTPPFSRMDWWMLCRKASAYLPGPLITCSIKYHSACGVLRMTRSLDRLPIRFQLGCKVAKNDKHFK